MMSAFVFLCDLATEQECLDRKLFGSNPGERVQSYRKIVPGDTLFLYNLDTGMMRGPFAAASACAMNIEPSAWKKSRRKFPWQVRVENASVFKVSLTADRLSEMSLLSPTPAGVMPQPDLTNEQCAGLLEEFRKANPK